MATIQPQSMTNPSSISQAAAVAALTGPLDFLGERNTVFQEGHNLCLASFNATPGLTCRTPDGTFYLFPYGAGLIGKATVIESDVDFATYMLESVGVAVVPGSTFGLGPYVRISFATSTERLRDDRSGSA